MQQLPNHVQSAQKAAELEAARSEAQAQLLVELDALRRHKATAEEQRRRTELQARLPGCFQGFRVRTLNPKP